MFVAGRLAEVRKDMADFAAGFDPALLTAGAAERAVKDAAAIENMAATVKALAAKRVGECSGYQRRGARGPAEDLARQTGIGVGQARALLETAERLDNQPEVSEAARRGELSTQQTAAITDAAAADPAAETKLLEKAKRSSLAELREECARTKTAADPDADATHKRIHDARSCQNRRTAEGGGEIIYRSTLDEIAEAWAVISGFANTEFKTARKEGRREPPDAYAADGFLNMCRTAAANTAPANTDSGDAAAKPAPVKPAKAIIRVDWDALIRGWPIDGEVAEIAGIGPVPVSVINALLNSGDIFLAVVVTKGKDVINVAHLGRNPTVHQDTAMQWRDPTCTRQGCHQLWLQRDHRQPWADTKITLLRWMDRLCPHDHHLKTHKDWSLVEGTGKRPFVPPDDPRHPNNTRSAEQARDGPLAG